MFPSFRSFSRLSALAAACLLCLPAGTALAAQSGASSQTAAKSARASHQHARQTPEADPVSRAHMLQGAWGPYRANNDLLYYHLRVRVDPAKKVITGNNTIRFRMLKDGKRIQIDLQQPLKVDEILFGKVKLHYRRDHGAVFIDFPETLHKGKVYSIDFHYSGRPDHHGRFGGMSFGTDSAGHPWIYTACEGVGSSVWWPSKDQWHDEVTHMDISVSVPDDLVDVSNGRFLGKKKLPGGYTQWNWHVDYPINSYDVALNIGNYVHFADRWGTYYVLPQDLAKARKQFRQVGTMMKAYAHYFGPYPFAKDGYKLVQVPYAGMEHQSAVAYGNGFENGYYGKNWSGVGDLSKRFDFIIIHESGHEWFGNAVSAADRADMWIQEGWTTYMEGLYVEYRWGKKNGIAYLNGLKSKVRNRRPIISEHGVAAEPPEDQYFKGALMINTLRSIVDDDTRWFQLIHDFYQHFKYHNVTTPQVVAWFNQHTGKNLAPVFNQYLRHRHVPTLDLLFGESPGQVMYKWKADEADFAMPVKVGRPGHWRTIHPTTHWQWMQSPLSKKQFRVATDLYYVNVDKQ